VSKQEYRLEDEGGEGDEINFTRPSRGSGWVWRFPLDGNGFHKVSTVLVLVRFVTLFIPSHPWVSRRSLEREEEKPSIDMNRSFEYGQVKCEDEDCSDHAERESPLIWRYADDESTGSNVSDIQAYAT
jgi:hypothetical protein